VKKKKKTLLLSYPRSGNTLMRYFLEFVTSQPTQGYVGSGQDGNPIANKCTHISINLSLPKIYKSHGAAANEHDKFNKTEDRLILLLRNPLECFIRHLGVKTIMAWTTSSLTRSCGISHPKYYFKNIEFYDNWEGEKHIFYYEDAIEIPRRHWESVNNFVGGDSKKLEKFMINLEWHLSESHRNYSAGETNGKKSISHSLKLDKQQTRKIKEKILLGSGNLKENKFLIKYNIIEDSK